MCLGKSIESENMFHLNSRYELETGKPLSRNSVAGCRLNRSGYIETFGGSRDKRGQISPPVCPKSSLDPTLSF